MPVRQALIAASITVFLCLFFGVFLINALATLISPRAWLEFPEWFPTSGYMKMRKGKYSAGWGAMQVRIIGLLFLCCVFGMFFFMFERH